VNRLQALSFLNPKDFGLLDSGLRRNDPQFNILTAYRRHSGAGRNPVVQVALFTNGTAKKFASWHG